MNNLENEITSDDRTMTVTGSRKMSRMQIQALLAMAMAMPGVSRAVRSPSQGGFLRVPENLTEIEQWNKNVEEKKRLKKRDKVKL